MYVMVSVCVHFAINLVLVVATLHSTESYVYIACCCHSSSIQWTIQPGVLNTKLLIFVKGALVCMRKKTFVSGRGNCAFTKSGTSNA